LPFPGTPATLTPQQSTGPLAISADVNMPPAEIAMPLVIPLTITGVEPPFSGCPK